MPQVTRLIGLSLGADSCWPFCYEEILRRLKLKIPFAGDRVSFEVERLSIEPFDLQQPCRYDVVLDRLTHWYHTSREWIKKAVVLDDLYVLNNPWSLQSMEKQTTYCAMLRLGLPVPRTFMVPPKDYEHHADLKTTLDRYAQLFDLGAVGERVGYPLFIKPYDGGAWVGVNRIESSAQLEHAYEESGKKVMHLQESVEGWDLFVRCLGVGPQLNVIRYDPQASLHDRYKIDFHFITSEEYQNLRNMTLTINTFFGWDFNSCEALRRDGVFHPIDFANACPDSQVTSLHFHFPWLIKAQLRWSIFCATTKRKMRQTLDWDPYYDIARSDRSASEKLREYGRIAETRLETDRFREFCAKHLPHLDEVAWEFFGSPEAKAAIRSKVASLFPAHEVERFTEHYWGLIGFWRSTEADRLGKTDSLKNDDPKQESEDRA